MVMSVLEIVIISAGLSLDVFVAMAYMGADFQRSIRKIYLVYACFSEVFNGGV
mgnify:FL=1